MDDFTMEMRLCDGGIADLDLLAWMRALGGHPAYDGPAFPCTGSAHLCGQHVRCTSPFHERRIPDPQVASLLESAAAAERVAFRLYNERGVPVSTLVAFRGIPSAGATVAT